MLLTCASHVCFSRMILVFVSFASMHVTNVCHLCFSCILLMYFFACLFLRFSYLFFACLFPILYLSLAFVSHSVSDTCFSCIFLMYASHVCFVCRFLMYMSDVLCFSCICQFFIHYVFPVHWQLMRGVLKGLVWAEGHRVHGKGATVEGAVEVHDVSNRVKVIGLQGEKYGLTNTNISYPAIAGHVFDHHQYACAMSDSHATTIAQGGSWEEEKGNGSWICQAESCSRRTGPWIGVAHVILLLSFIQILHGRRYRRITCVCVEFLD